MVPRFGSHRLAILLFVVALFGGLVLAVPATDADEPSDVAVLLPDDRVVAGEETTLVFQVVNRDTGPAETMQGTIVDVNAADAPLSIRTSEQALGVIPAGASRTTGFEAVVDEDAEPGTYDLEVDVSYIATEGSPDGFDDTGLIEGERVTETVTVSVTVEEQARFQVTDVTTDVHVGEPGVVTLELANVGTQAARNATIQVQSTDPALNVGGATTFTRTFGGEWPVGERRTVNIAARIDDGTEARTHVLETGVNFYDDLGVSRSDDVREIGIEVGPRQDFDIPDLTSTLRVGQEGSLEVQLTNDGNRTVQNVVGVLESPNPNVDVTDAESSAGTLAPGETARLSYTVDIAQNADDGERVLPLVVRYRTPGGDVVRSDQLDVAGVEVAPAQTFGIADVASTLRVGKDGRVNATLVNEGDQRIEGVVAVVESPNPNVAVRDPEWYVGPLDPGETDRVSFRIGLREDAEPGERLLPLLVRYRTPTDEVVVSDPLDVPVTVTEAVDPFSVEEIDRTIQQGEEIAYEVAVRNTGDQLYSDIEAQLFANPPLETTDNEAYIPELAPGETVNITFGLAADGDATMKSYPISIDFRYEDEIGDRHLTDRLRLSVEVVESDPSLFLIVAGLVVLFAILAALAYWLRGPLQRRLDETDSG